MAREVSFELSLSPYEDDRSSHRGSFHRARSKSPSGQNYKLEKLTLLDPVLRDLYDDDASTNSGRERRRVHRYQTKRYSNGSAVISTDHMRSFDRELAELGAGVRPAQVVRRKSQFQHNNSKLDVVDDRNRSTSFLTPDPFESGRTVDLNQRVVNLDRTRTTPSPISRSSISPNLDYPQVNDSDKKKIFAKKAKIVKIIRHGPPPQQFINLLLNHRTSNNFHRILYELNTNFELRHNQQTYFHPIEKLFTPNGKKVNCHVANDSYLFVILYPLIFNSSTR